MDEYAVDILPGEVLGWIREDQRSAAPHLSVSASKEYVIDDGPGDMAEEIVEDDLRPVSVIGLLELSPRSDGGWTLQLRASESLGMIPAGEHESYENDYDMSVEAFEDELLVPEKGEAEVILLAEDAAARQRFERWLARRRGGQ